MALLILSSPESIAAPTTNEISKYLVIGMGDDAHIDNAFQMSNSEIGADRNILSNSEIVWSPEIGSSFPNLLGVFEKRWNLSTKPDSLNLHSTLFEGIDWSGNVALTSDNSSFDSANSLVFADFGVGTAATKSQYDSVDEQSRYFAKDNSASPVALRSQGTSNGNNFSPLLTELSEWKAYLNGLVRDTVITKNDIEKKFVNNSAADGTGGLRSDYTDAMDVNNDGVILVDIESEGIDFSVNNTDWVINGTGNKLIVFRINRGANMLMSNASITLGSGGLANTNGVIFYQASENAKSSDSVFSGSNVVLNGGAFWDLNDVGEGSDGSDGHNIVINNGQGCWQFVSQKINFQNNRWNKCAYEKASGEPVATDLKLTKTVDKSVFKHGDTVLYTLTLNNESAVTATGVNVTDHLPIGLTLTKATPSQGIFNNGVWDVGTLPAKTASTLVIEAKVE